MISPALLKSTRTIIILEIGSGAANMQALECSRAAPDSMVIGVTLYGGNASTAMRTPPSTCCVVQQHTRPGRAEHLQARRRAKTPGSERRKR